MQSGFTPTLCTTAIALALGFVSLHIEAQDKESARNKMEVIEVHGVVSDADMIVDQNNLEKIQANDLADIFRSLPEVSVGGSNPIAQKIYIRGIEDTMLNVSIDGALQSGYLFHHQGRLALEPELIKQVDVVAGAGDATSGSGALGGALRFTTKQADDLLKADENFGALIKLGYYSNSKGFKASSTFYGRFNTDWTGLLTLAKRDTDDMTDGRGNTLDYTASEQEVGFAKLNGQLTQSQAISISHDVRQDDGTRLLRAHWHPSRKNPAVPQQSQRETTTLNYDWSPQENPLFDVSLNVYDTKNYIEHTHEGENGTRNIYHAVFESTGFDLKNTAQLDAHKIIVGLDYRTDDAKLEDIGTVYDLEGKESGSVIGLYAQDYFQLTDALQLSYGVRFDDYSLEDDRGVKFDSNGFSPNLNVSYQFNDNLSLYSGFAQALRGQKVKELFVLGYYENDANLSEEIAKNYEVGFKYIGDALVLTGDVFVSYIDDAVSTSKNNEQIESSILTNVGDIKNDGFNLSARYHFDLFSASLAFGRSQPKWESHINEHLTGSPLTDQDWSIGTTSGDTWTAALHYSPMSDLEMTWQARIVSRLTETGVNVWDNSQLPEKPGYAVHDLQAKWYPFSDESFTVNAAIKNMFDKYYFDHASYGSLGPIDTGIAEAGRDVRITLAWQF